MEKIFEQWVASARSETGLDDLQIGVDISSCPELKIAFDGYAEGEDEIEDLNIESYAVYIHKDAASPNFAFPKYSRTHPGQSCKGPLRNYVTLCGTTQMMHNRYKIWQACPRVSASKRL